MRRVRYELPLAFGFEDLERLVARREDPVPDDEEFRRLSPHGLFVWPLDHGDVHVLIHSSLLLKEFCCPFPRGIVGGFRPVMTLIIHSFLDLSSARARADFAYFSVFSKTSKPKSGEGWYGGGGAGTDSLSFSSCVSMGYSSI